MKRRILKILGFALFLGILGFGYVAKDPIRILWIQQQAIRNYKTNFEYFNSINTRMESNCFYLITLGRKDSIEVSISNVDTKDLDHAYNNEAWNSYENMIRMNIDTIQIESYNNSTGKLSIRLGEEIEEIENWKLLFEGHQTNQQLAEVLKELNINQNKFQNSVPILIKTKCKSLLTHKNGIELTYDNGFTFRAGCVKNKYYPIKYNLGKGDFLSDMGRLKVLNDRTQCYIRY